MFNDANEFLMYARRLPMPRPQFSIEEKGAHSDIRSRAINHYECQYEIAIINSIQQEARASNRQFILWIRFMSGPKGTRKKLHNLDSMVINGRKNEKWHLVIDGMPISE